MEKCDEVREILAESLGNDADVVNITHISNVQSRQEWSLISNFDYSLTKRCFCKRTNTAG